MMKRTIAMLLVLVMALSMIPVTAGAADLSQSYLDIPQRYSRGYDYESNNTKNSANIFGADSGYVEGKVGDYDDPYDWYYFTITGNYCLVFVGGSGTPTATTKFDLYNSAGKLIETAAFDYKESHPTQSNGDNADNYYGMVAELTPGTYYIRVSETNTRWISSYYFETALLPMLNTPTVSTSNRASDGKVKISWNSVSYASSYKVLRSTSKNGSYTTLTTTTGTTYYDTSAVAGTTYWYKVQAISGSSSYLNSNYSTPDDRTCDLPRPTNVKATRNASSGKVKISWSKVTGADKYTLYIYDANGNLLKSSTTTGTSLTHTSATVGTTYTYKVKAIDSDNSAANSALSTWVKGTAVCARPEITVSNVASSGKIKVSWSKITGAAKYTLYIYDANGDLLKTTTTTGTSLTHTSATAGTTYTYKLEAIGSVSGTNSSLSDAKSRTCDLPRPTVSVTINSNGKPKVSWNKVSGAVKYTLYIYDYYGNLIKSTTTTGTSLTHTSSVRGVTYTYKVVAVASKSAANSAYSSAVSATAR